MKLRIKFKKYGPVRFIGHLDVMRFYQKALRRAGIDVAYTTGFSPHQVMSFAAPLGVGLTSNGEYMDIQVNSLPAEQGKEYSDRLNPCRLLVDRLNAASVQGLDVISARILPEDAGNAMASVAAASYTVRFREGRGPDIIGSQSDDSGKTQPLQNAIAAFLSKDEIIITKESKKGTREVNLRPGIYELTWQDDSFFMILDASSAGNIKPAQVISALLENCGEMLKENALLITREDVFTDLGEGENHRFVSLGEIGSEEPFSYSLLAGQPGFTGDIDMDYHDCEFEQIGENIYRYYYGSKSNHTAWVTIKRTEKGKWYYLRLNNVSSSAEFPNLQICIDAAYADMVRSKL